MKTTQILPLILIALTLVGFRISTCFGDDLNDGISKATDDAISAEDDLGQPDKNIKYIVRKAKTNVEEQSGGAEGGNMNSAVFGAGSVIKGPVTIIDNSTGDKTQVVN